MTRTTKTINKIKSLPDSAGVYFFLGEKKRILYIGKATSLKSRVGSYFNKNIDTARSNFIKQMVDLAVDIDFVETDSVLEALILEANLIKKHKPKYNIREKDDKSFNHVLITKEDFPRVLVVRGKDLADSYSVEEIRSLFGPFPNAGALKDAVRIIRKIFPFRDKCTPAPLRFEIGKMASPCFNSHIGLCPGVCADRIGEKEYRKTIRNIELFFQGKKKTLTRKLKAEMRAYAKKREFEKAGDIKRTIFALEHIQDVALIKNETLMAGFESGMKPFRIEAYDISHMSGSDTVGVMVAIEKGKLKKTDYRKFRIRGQSSGAVTIDDTKNLREVLERRLKHDEWEYPNVIVVDGGRAQYKVAVQAVKEAGLNIDVLSVIKDEKHKPRDIIGHKLLRDKYKKDILLANSEAHRFAMKYHKELRGKII
jgi:excinuclease ABC subunit C